MPNLLFLDLETTGPDLDDRIVEVAALLVRADDLAVLDEYTAVVALDPDGWAKLRRLPVVLDMHTSNGLIDDLSDPSKVVELGEAEDRLLDWFSDDRPVTLAGSGVAAFDHPMVRAHMPRLASRLTYYSHDVGHPRRQFREATGHLLTKVDGLKTHRALDDVRCHLEEYRTFRQLFQVAFEAILTHPELLDGHPELTAAAAELLVATGRVSSERPLL